MIPPTTVSREICSFERKWHQVSIGTKIKCLGNFSDKSAKRGEVIHGMVLKDVLALRVAPSRIYSTNTSSISSVNETSN